MLQFIVLPGRFAVCQFPLEELLPDWLFKSSFFSVSKSVDELSIVCEQHLVEGEMRKSEGWKLLKINSVLDLSLTGITAQFSTVLAKAGVNLSVIATFNTDYILVEEIKLKIATEALRRAGFEVVE